MFGSRDWQWHQKLTVTVETPEGVKTGSAVTRVSVQASPRWWGVGDAAGSGSSSLSGEAVTVDLGEGRHLFALLQNYSHETARKTFIEKKDTPRSEAEAHVMFDRLEQMRDSRALARENYPLLVTFGDINEPASVTKVDPADLAATFGKGYRLNAVTIAITDEPVTEGKVEKVLSWWGNKQLFKSIWPSLTSDVRSLLSSFEWKRG